MRNPVYYGVKDFLPLNEKDENVPIRGGDCRAHYQYALVVDVH